MNDSANTWLAIIAVATLLIAIAQISVLVAAVEYASAEPGPARDIVRAPARQGRPARSVDPAGRRRSSPFDFTTRVRCRFDRLRPDEIAVCSPNTSNVLQHIWCIMRTGLLCRVGSVSACLSDHSSWITAHKIS